MRQYLNTGIKESVIQEIREYCKTYGTMKLILFGSRARGDYTDCSDIDLAVYGGNYVRLALAIDEETSTLLSFDIVDMNRPVEARLKESIEKEGIVIYEKI